MCCFSGSVRSVSKTRIFARDAGNGSQILVYSMTLSADEDLAMVLGIPVRPGSGEQALRFIDLSGYPGIFEAFDKGYIQKPPPQGRGLPMAAPRTAPLAVVAVGSFEASYVPTIADFTRLDARFRMPAGVLEALPGQGGFGYAVFKLKRGARTIHPMAFEFPRADASRLFFPTVHVHDGRVSPTADFDHTFYYQRANGERDPTVFPCPWEETLNPAKRFTEPGRSKGVIAPELNVYRMKLWGNALNQDTYV